MFLLMSDEQVTAELSGNMRSVSSLMARQERGPISRQVLKDRVIFRENRPRERERERERDGRGAGRFNPEARMYEERYPPPQYEHTRSPIDLRAS